MGLAEGNVVLQTGHVAAHQWGSSMAWWLVMHRSLTVYATT